MRDPLSAGAAAEGRLRLEWRPFAFALSRPLHTSQGLLLEKRGWLLRLETAAGAVGWGEAAALEPDPGGLAAAIDALGTSPERRAVEGALPRLPAVLAFALGAALGEADGCQNGGTGPESTGWLPAPVSAVLLPAGEAMTGALESLLCEAGDPPQAGSGRAAGPTLKWKVAAAADPLERRLLEHLLDRMPADARLRLDANGGWDRATATAWAERLVCDPRLEWLEQPLPPADQEGLERLAVRVPVALDESLRRRPELRATWAGWQVRRPSQEGDPRPLLLQLRRGIPRRMLSTGFETVIGRRWLAHLAAWQARGPTPAAPGLAPGWTPGGGLFSGDPALAWEGLG